MNKYMDHVYVIPEDDANRQIAVGFVDHPGVKDLRIQIMPVAGGWGNVLKAFKDEYIHRLKANSKAHVVMLIDFDDSFTQRREAFENEIPAEIKSRVFVVGSRSTPETLRNVLNKNFEKIGESLADDCDVGTSEYWGHEQLNHNEPDRQRLDQIVRPFLF
jgi:hypothetical protein